MLHKQRDSRAGREARAAGGASGEASGRLKARAAGRTGACRGWHERLEALPRGRAVNGTGGWA
jgi:hypothetical protein